MWLLHPPLAQLLFLYHLCQAQEDGMAKTEEARERDVDEDSCHKGKEGWSQGRQVSESGDGLSLPLQSQEIIILPNLRFLFYLCISRVLREEDKTRGRARSLVLP